MAGITGGDDPTAEIRPYRIQRDTTDVEKLLAQIKNSCDSFKNTTSEKLFNISSGKAASPPVQTCLIGMRERGKERHDDFVTSCFNDPVNFEKPLKREKLYTFKQECKANKNNPDKRVGCSNT